MVCGFLTAAGYSTGMLWSPDELLMRLRLALEEPLRLFASDASSKLWWPFVVVSLVAVWLLAGQTRTTAASPGKVLTTLFEPRQWLSRSARNDYLILFINPLLQVTILSWLVVNFGAVASWIVTSLTWFGVHGQSTGLVAACLGLVLTAALFVVDDLARWLTHYLQHRIPVLWEFHKVHHSAEVLNFLTVQRHHPLDPLLTTAVIGLSTAAVNGLFIGLFGDHLTIATVAGANVFRAAANALGGVLRHSPFWLSFGSPVERWLVSPAMHHMHHSSDPRHFDNNFGTALSVWDRLAGTLRLADGAPVTDFGIGAETRQFQTLPAIYLGPLRRVAGWLPSWRKNRAACAPDR